MKIRRSLLALTLALVPTPALAGGAAAGGYFRVMTRPDLQGGNGKLGYWNLYGRLLNEGPYAALELRFDVLEPQPGTDQLWTSLHAKIEGGSIGNADAGDGSLDHLRLSQVYVLAGNVLMDRVTWQVGTLETWFGDLGLYDMRPAGIFNDTVGLSARYQGDRLDLLLGLGDSGYGLYGASYDTVFTPGGTARLKLGKHLELGAGGEFRYEPGTEGDTASPYQTPGVDYEDWVRGEVVQRYLEEYPGLEDYFPDPEARSSKSGAAIGYLGFGGFGPVRWNNLFLRYERLHPERSTTETVDGRDYTIYVHDLTDQRTQLTVGDELQLALIPDRLDMALGGLYIDAQDGDNQILPTDYDRTCMSAVGRVQVYATPSLHVLLEGSAAKEQSHNGNTFRDHKDSIFANTGGQPDTDGLETGDDDTRVTFQGKGGLVLNPLGPGIYTRPSLRLLYGVQYSTQNNAFGNSFVDSLDQYATFDAVEQHWHHLLALETEIWF